MVPYMTSATVDVKAWDKEGNLVKDYIVQNQDEGPEFYLHNALHATNVYRVEVRFGAEVYRRSRADEEAGDGPLG